MTDDWRNLEVWERVRWARTQRFDSATAAAKAVGMLEGTYRCYERGPKSAKFIRLDYDKALKFAREFKVRWEWLLEGAGQPWLTAPDTPPEAGGAPNYLRVWREYRGMTLAQLAKKAGTSAQVIADLESGAVELSSKWLRTLAPALDIEPGYLQGFDPNEVDPTLVDAVRAIPKERRGQALQILKTFKSPTRPR